MKRSPRPYAALLGVVLLAVTSASEAAVGGGTGPLGVTVAAGVTAGTARVGALFGADDAVGPGGLVGTHFCTASVVRSPHRDLLVTAAHCLAGQGPLVFVPGYRDGKAPYGVWRVERDFLPDGWAERRDEDSDVAFAVVGEKGGKGVEDVVGGNRFVTRTDVGATAVTVTGYPDSRETPLTCSDRPRSHSRTQQRIDCPGLSGGTSGSPWVNGFGEVVGVLGGHEQGGATDDISYSVALGAEAAALYRRAASAP
ncbi:trypsin-like peptidase domain-containing protein [Streptomyces sp. ID05-47C]|uniref:trypsin-like peptidase domain-containing protein n=1 Tax=Streptomyces sp. ID05-47C TaxID=3028665 RepID=UPI0029B8EDB8|nr:trypsin-like peptidase domain-containing protein [Streptomyces sp. ID05-47C]MDX3574079.1 trypsin-like peptidase domain-containing protein [Streptomyces sp. ID05-47C]